MDIEWPGKFWKSFRRHPVKTGGAVVFLVVVWAIYQFGGSFIQEKARQIAFPEHKATSSSQIKVAPGAILAPHYPTGELFVVDPSTGHTTLLSTRLGEPSAIAVRSDGELVVLDAKQGLVIGINPDNGSHTFSYTGEALWNQRPIALALESDRYAVIAVQNHILRLDLENGMQQIVSQGALFTVILGIDVDISGSIFMTDLSGKLIEVDPQTGSQRLISEGGLLNHPRGPIVESHQTVLVGTSGKNASVIRVDRVTGQQSVVATGPFVTIAGMAVSEDGCIFVADNGRGAPGDGFIARVDPQKGKVEKVVTAQSTEWRFFNGRAIAIVPRS